MNKKKINKKIHGLEGLAFSMKPNNSLLAYAVLVYGGFECEPEGMLPYFFVSLY